MQGVDGRELAGQADDRAHALACLARRRGRPRGRPRHPGAAASTGCARSWSCRRRSGRAARRRCRARPSGRCRRARPCRRRTSRRPVTSMAGLRMPVVSRRSSLPVRVRARDRRGGVDRTADDDVAPVTRARTSTVRSPGCGAASAFSSLRTKPVAEFRSSQAAVPSGTPTSSSPYEPSSRTDPCATSPMRTLP